MGGGYTNGEGFLAPYRGTRYHLSQWETPPINEHEYFNLRDASAIYRALFWTIDDALVFSKESLFLSDKTQCQIITASCFIHNLIRTM